MADLGGDNEPVAMTHDDVLDGLRRGGKMTEVMSCFSRANDDDGRLLTLDISELVPGLEL